MSFAIFKQDFCLGNNSLVKAAFIASANMLNYFWESYLTGT